MNVDLLCKRWHPIIMTPTEIDAVSEETLQKILENNIARPEFGCVDKESEAV